MGRTDSSFLPRMSSSLLSGTPAARSLEQLHPRHQDAATQGKTHPRDVAQGSTVLLKPAVEKATNITPVHSGCAASRSGTEILADNSIYKVKSRIQAYWLIRRLC